MIAQKYISARVFGVFALLTALILGSPGCAGEDATADGPVASSNDAAASDAGGIAQDSGTSSGGASSGGSSSGGTSSGGTSSGGTSSGGTSSGGQVDAGGTEDTGGGTTLPGELVALTLEPAVATIPAGASLALELTGKFDDGTSANLNTVAKWSTSNPDAISVSQTGLALGVSAGSATVTATVGTKFATAQVAVSSTTVKGLEIAPTDGKVKIGGTLAFSAIALMSDGAKETVTDAVTWSSSDTNIATIDTKGVATGVAAGSAVITGKLGAHQVTANLAVQGAAVTGVTVDPVDPTLTVGETVSFTATASYDDGALADVTKASKWSSTAPDIVTVDAQGNATAKAVGTATIAAEFVGVTASRVVTVKAATLSKLVVTPDKAAVAAGGQQAFKVTGTFSDGAEKDLTASVLWAVEPENIAAISNAPGSQGVTTGLVAGAATVTATFGKVEGSAALTVTAATLKSIQVQGGTTLAKGVQKQLKAVGTYSDGKALDISDKVTWESSDAKVLTVSNTAPKGWIAAVAEGKATVTASLDGINAKAEITVSAAALIKVSVEPGSLQLEAGAKANLVAKAQYSDGSVVDVTAQVVWSSSDPTVVSVSNAKGTEGLVSALKAGKVTVKAALGSTSTSVEVTVAQPKLVELTIGPHNVSRKAGQYVQYWAIAVYSNKTTQNVTQQATWSTSDSDIAQVFNNGQYKGVAQAKKAGAATITCKFAGKEASTKLTVTNPTLVSVQVSPVAWETPVGIPMRFQAVALFSDDTSQNVTIQASWSSSNTTVATVNNGGGGGFGGNQQKGRINAKSPGKAEISATYQGKTGKATLTVSPAKMTGLQIFPGKQTMPVGDFRKFEANLLWSDGKSTQVTNFINWTSSDASVAGALNGNGQKGLVQGLKPGTTTITAAGMGFSATATLEVTAATVSSLQLTPAHSTVAKGVPVLYKLAAVFTDGTTQDVTWQATFKSSDPSIAAVNNANGGFKGMAQTLKAGTVTIEASAKGKTAKATLVVKPAELKEVQVSPVNPQIAIGAFTKLEAVAVYTDDSTQQISWLATWTSSKADVAAVSNLNQPGKGFVQGLKTGATEISATWGGKTGKTTVTVQQAALIEIQVTPFSPILAVGYPLQFQATGIFADNTTQQLTEQVSWTSSNGKVASVASAWGQKGYVTPLSAGETEIVATFGGKQGKTKLKVTGAALKSIEVKPAAVTLTVQQSAQLVATGTFTDGTQLMLNPYVLWKSDNPGVAPVNNAGGQKGQVKGIAKGSATVSAIKGNVSGSAKVTVQ